MMRVADMAPSMINGPTEKESTGGRIFIKDCPKRSSSFIYKHEICNSSDRSGLMPSAKLNDIGI